MTDEQQSPWPAALKAAVSIWILWHMASIIVAAASVPPSSISVQNTWRFFAPYLQGLNLNHGFHYFAPNPGASSLIGWNIDGTDSSQKSGRFPTADIQPRLLYHRYFMLSENLGSLPEHYRTAVIRSYGRHLCRASSADEVQISRIVHMIPTVESVRDGGGLDAPENYSEEPLETVSCKD